MHHQHLTDGIRQLRQRTRICHVTISIACKLCAGFRSGAVVEDESKGDVLWFAVVP